jgi:hypothetical protein
MFDLPSFLKKGLTTAYFRECGKIPEESDLLHIWVKGKLMKGELTFRNIRRNF